MKSLNQKLKEEFVLQARRQIVSIFDFEIKQQCHILKMKSLVLFSRRCAQLKNLCAKYEH